MQPTVAEEGKIWLGVRDADPNIGGWFEIVGQVTDSQLGIFERRIVIGDATKDADDYISSMIFSDWTGGGQIRDLNESSDVNRFWWALLDTRVVSQITLPPRIGEYRISGSNSIVRPLGDIGTHTYVAFGTSAHGFDTPNDEFFATTNALGGTPVRRATAFQGYVFIPLGADGFCRVSETTPATGTLTVTANSALSGAASAIDAVDFCVLGRKMYAIDILGKLYSTTDGATFESIFLKDAPSTQVQVPTNYTPRGLISFWDKLGIERLHIITSRAVFLYMESAQDVEISALKFAPHPRFGLGFAQWRSGENLWISAGDDCIQFAGGANIVPGSGLRRDAGLPPTHRGYICDLQDEMSSLFALVQGTTIENLDEMGLMSVDMTDWGTSYQLFDVSAGVSSLCLQTGSGWHAFWEADDPTLQVTSMAMGATDDANYALWWGDTRGNAYRLQQYPDFHNPLVGIYSRAGRFQDYGEIYTGRFDASMMGFDKIASHAFVHWEELPLGTDLEVWYNTDKDTTYRKLGAADRSSQSNVLLFNTDDSGFSWGERFNWIEFWLRFSSRQVADPLDPDLPVAASWMSPALRSMSFHYTKRPQNATSLSLVVQLEDSQESQGGGEAYLYLRNLIEADTMVKLVYGRRSFRCRVAGVEKMGYSGMDDTGQVKVNLIDIQPASL